MLGDRLVVRTVLLFSVAAAAGRRLCVGGLGRSTRVRAHDSGDDFVPAVVLAMAT